MTSIDSDLLARYVSDGCTPFERAQVDRWLGEFPDRTAAVAALREVATETRAMTAARKAAMLAAVKRQPAAVPAARRFTLPKRSSWAVGLGVAAILAVLAGVAVGRRAFRQRLPVVALSPAPGLRSFATAPGQRLALRLPDGTAVALAPASLLRLAADYGTRTRMVDLEGEAVFTVRHDAARPFAVRTSRGVVRDLGTRFAVRAYPDDPAAEIVVAEGAVAVLPDPAAARRDSIVLTPGDGARLTAEGSVTVRHGIALDPYFAWTVGRLVFRDVPLREAAARLSRWYDVDVRVASSEAGDRLLTAAFGDDAAADVLPLIAASLKLQLTQSGRIYTFAK